MLVTFGEGGCGCGAVRYTLLAPPTDVMDCHCRLCQRYVGAVSVTWATVAAEALELTRGTVTWVASSASARRGFCARCGTSLFFAGNAASSPVDVTVATLDHPERCPPTAQIWVRSRQPWAALLPGLPAHADAGPDWTP